MIKELFATFPHLKTLNVGSFEAKHRFNGEEIPQRFLRGDDSYFPRGLPSYTNAEKSWLVEHGIDEKECILIISVLNSLVVFKKNQELKRQDFLENPGFSPVIQDFFKS